eukprot:1158392-Pelagomonas_calceolata.AAC.11
MSKEECPEWDHVGALSPLNWQCKVCEQFEKSLSSRTVQSSRTDQPCLDHDLIIAAMRVTTACSALASSDSSYSARAFVAKRQKN